MEKNLSKQYYTYIYRDPSCNNEPIYVGKGHGSRASTHLSRSDNHPFINRLNKMKVNGVAPFIEIINAIDEDHAFFLEECCIESIGRKDLKKGTLLNLTDGGEGGSGAVRSQTHKDIISAALTGLKRSVESKEKNRQAHLGKKQSAQTKLAKSAAAKGRQGTPCTSKTKESLRQFNLGKTITLCSCLLCKKTIGVTNISRHYGTRSCTYKVKYKQPVCSCVICRKEIPVNGLHRHQGSNNCNSR